MKYKEEEPVQVRTGSLISANGPLHPRWYRHCISSSSSSWALMQAEEVLQVQALLQ
jgi:hypothetical protein